MDKNKLKEKLTIKNISKTFGVVIFLLVFVFTFLFSSELKKYWVILVSVFGGLIFLVGIVWLTMALVIKYKKDRADKNKQNIKKALDKLEEKAKEAQKNN